ncbi:MAG: Sip1-related alpha-galactosidase [Planctomycetota bacterium]
MAHVSARPPTASADAAPGPDAGLEAPGALPPDAREPWWQGSAPQVSLIRDARSAGAWVKVCLPQPEAEFSVALGRPVGWVQATACYRENVCWMRPWHGVDPARLPRETQFLLYRVPHGYRLIAPVLSGAHRMSLSASPAGALLLRGDSGDPRVQAREFDAAYVLHGRHPHEMLRVASRAIARRSPELALRKHKPTPGFVDDLGWCSYNAFYNDIGHDKVRRLLQSYADAGVLPRTVILDEGWMRSSADQRLASFEADREKFPRGLDGFIADLKRMGVRSVILWHAFAGYWRGAERGCEPGVQIDPAGTYLPDRLVDDTATTEPAGDEATVGESFYPHAVVSKPVGLASPGLGGFYDAFHASLRAQGVDGVKIDAMAWIEMHGLDRGGRVAVMRDLVRAAEASAEQHFDDNLLNCSSCSSDFFLQALRANVTRTSCDFFPDRPETHGEHLWINAHVSTWVGEWVLPDWDMFQTGHEAGAYHAAARAISGGPVYATDEPSRQDPDLLRRLAAFDGRIPRCVEPARVAEDNLMVDPTTSDALLKVVNRNRYGAVVGLFHCRSGSDREPTLTGAWSPRDAPGIPHGAKAEYACWSETKRSLRRVAENERTALQLGRYGYEVVTVGPIQEGFAAIGLEDLLNPGGALLAIRREAEHVEIDLMDGGAFVAYAKKRPRLVEAQRTPSPQQGPAEAVQSTPFEHDVSTGMLRVYAPPARRTTLRIAW